MARRRTGRLTLTAPARSAGRCRQALSALAAELIQVWELAGLSVTVRFGRGVDKRRRVA
jgi:hypothetical protein